ncbi:MAG: GNAT family N-acetyltransferase [Clostridia bacterium]|nr:GNAT family N-acetyltransferase [Clostridia bacterium]
MNIRTERLNICEFTPDMAEAVHLNSLDEDNRRFVPDEVFETVEDAAETVDFLMSQYGGTEGPLVYPVLLKDGTNIGYVQAVPLDDGVWELGYHIAKAYTKKGYASEAVRAFLPVVMERLHLDTMLGVCLADNFASRRVMEKCGFVKCFEGVGPYQGAERPICRYTFTRT